MAVVSGRFAGVFAPLHNDFSAAVAYLPIPSGLAGILNHHFEHSGGPYTA